MLGWFREWQREREEIREALERIAWRKANLYQPHELSKQIRDEYTGDLIRVRGDDPRPEVILTTMCGGPISTGSYSGNPLSGSSSATPSS